MSSPAAFRILVVIVIGVIVGLTSPTEAGRWGNDPCKDPCVPGSEDIMKPKAHGTSEYPVVSSKRQRIRVGSGVCL
jgi:hypothetical protein